MRKRRRNRRRRKGDRRSINLTVLKSVSASTCLCSSWQERERERALCCAIGAEVSCVCLLRSTTSEVRLENEVRRGHGDSETLERQRGRC
jgi:hypothetical protein